MYFRIKNKGLGLEQRCFIPDDAPQKDIEAAIKELRTGTVGVKDFSYTAQTQKAYTAPSEDITLVANGNALTEKEVKDNLYFVKQIASDTTIDTDRDKFELPILQEFAKQYGGGWGDGTIGGRAQCVMHQLSNSVGRTFRCEIQDAKNADGTVKLDNLNQVVKELVVYGYVITSKQYQGSPFVDSLKFGAMSKVSISAWIPFYEYIPSDRSNYYPYGDGIPHGYFRYTDPTGIKVIELSFVTEGANENARITKSLVNDNIEILKTVHTDKDGDIEVLIEDKVVETIETMEKAAETMEKAAETTEKATETTSETTENVEKEAEVPAESEQQTEIPTTPKDVTENIAKALAFYNNLPNELKNESISWGKITIQNAGATAKSYFVPNSLQTVISNLDKTVSVVSGKLKTTETDLVKERKENDANAQKAISLDLDLKKVQAEKTDLQGEIANLRKQVTEKETVLTKERDSYVNQYVILKARLENNVGKEEMIAAYTSHAKEMTIEQIKSKCGEYQSLLAQKINKEKLIETQIPNILGSEMANDF